MTAAIDKKLQSYIEELNAAQKKSVLSYIKTMLKGNEKEEEIYTIDDYNGELDEAEAEIARGEFSTNENVFENSKKLIDARKKA